MMKIIDAFGVQPSEFFKALDKPTRKNKSA